MLDVYPKKKYHSLFKAPQFEKFQFQGSNKSICRYVSVTDFWTTSAKTAEAQPTKEQTDHHHHHG